MNFNDFTYKRLSLDDIQTTVNHALQQFKEAGSFQEADQAFSTIQTEFDHIATMSTLCSIRHSINTADPFYEAEQTYWDETSPHISHLGDQFNKALMASPYLNEFKSHYPKTYFDLIEKSLKVFDPSIIEDLQEENKLSSDYEKVKSAAKIIFEGKEYTFAQMGLFTSDKDRARRKAANEAVYAKVQELQDQFDTIYDKLVKVRTKMAHKLGYPSFIEMAYDRMYRLDYNQDMVKVYRNEIKKKVVPIVSKLQNRQAKRIGLDHLAYYDAGLQFLNGNPKPIGSFEDTLKAGQQMYHEMSPQTKEFIDMMIDSNLLDLVAKENKRGGGYMTFLPDYGLPFIFSNFNGTSGDVDVLTHEAGHAFQGYQSRHIKPSDVVMATMESCEIHSMSMEFFAWPYMEKFFGKDANKYRFAHLSGAISFLPYGALVDHFQHEVYANPEWTPKQRQASWKKLAAEYMPYMNYEDNDFLASGARWYLQAHIFTSPFYYIDYTLAQVCAFQFWKRSQVDHDPKAWEDYLHICQIGGSKSFLGIVEAANLVSPFKEGALDASIQAIDTWLDAVDDQAL